MELSPEQEEGPEGEFCSAPVYSFTHSTPVSFFVCFFFIPALLFDFTATAAICFCFLLMLSVAIFGSVHWLQGRTVRTFTNHERSIQCWEVTSYM